MNGSHTGANSLSRLPLRSEVELRTASVLDIDELWTRIDELREQYVSAQPFPHIVLDDFLADSVVDPAIESFPSGDTDDWISYSHINERKFGNTRSSAWPSPLRSLLSELQSERFVEFLRALTGIEGLFADESLEGGGLHRSGAGGYLNIHADFTVHPKFRTWQRRVNLLLYLNSDWPQEYGGHLELWSRDMKRCEKKIHPARNRVVIFNTDADSFHGHPEPMTCPADRFRQSLALYYFTLEHEPAVRSTEYRARPDDGAKSALIYLDKQVLRVYDWAKRHTGISDDFASRLLQRFDRIRSRRRYR